MSVPHDASGPDTGHPITGAPRHCRRCGYPLAGLHTVGGRLTCPECGLTGTWADLLPPVLTPQLPWRRRLLFMCGPTALCLSLAAAVLAASLDENLASTLTLFGVLAGLLGPLVVAAYVIDREESSRRGIGLFLATVAAGWTGNILIVIGLLMVVSIAV